MADLRQLLAVGVLAIAGCAPATGPSVVQVGAFGVELDRCIEQNPDRQTIDACRTEARGRWCRQWPDAINCAGQIRAH